MEKASFDMYVYVRTGREHVGEGGAGVAALLGVEVACARVLRKTI